MSSSNSSNQIRHTTTNSNRKRCRTLVGWGLAVAAMYCDSATAFANHPPTLQSASRIAPIVTRTPQSPQRSLFVLQPLSMVASEHLTAHHDTNNNNNRKHKTNNNNNNNNNNNFLTYAPPRLPLEEQQRLLDQAVELRRIKQLETDLALRTPSKSPPLLSIRCDKAGYGEDLAAYEQAIRNGEQAREQLITHNMGLVHYCVNDIIGRNSASRKRKLNSLSREDLIQEGAIGLARALDRWNPDIGGRFSTYAVYWVRAAILRGIAEKDEIVRVPEHVSAAVRKMTRGAQKLGLDIDIGDDIFSSASWREAIAAKALAEEAGLTDRQLAEAMRIRNRRNAGGYIPFETWMQKGRDLESDVTSLVTTREDSSFRSLEVEDLKKTLGRYLRPKEMEALFWRYGLIDEESSSTAAKAKEPKNYLARAEEELYGRSSSTKSSTKPPAELPVQGKWGEAMSFTEVGKRMQVSAEYGRRLCHAALKKLRQAVLLTTLSVILFVRALRAGRVDGGLLFYKGSIFVNHWCRRSIVAGIREKEMLHEHR